jgi:hypothetical protein
MKGNSSASKILGTIAFDPDTFMTKQCRSGRAANRLGAGTNRLRKELSMEFMLMLYSDETLASKATGDELAKAFAEFGRVTEALKARNQLKHTQPLQPTSAATTVRVRNGKRTTTDGPFAETKEQIGGYYVIDVKSLDEAIEIAAQLPTSWYGSVEIRPIMRMGR